MGVLMIGGVLFGTILGRFFKVYILIPTCGAAIVLALAQPGLGGQSLARTCLEIIVLIASLQFGYVLGVLSSKTSVVLAGLRKTWSSSPSHGQSSRTLHVR